MPFSDGARPDTDCDQSVYQKRYFILCCAAYSDLLLLPDVFEKLQPAIRGKSEISELEKQAEIRTIQMEGGSGAEKGLSYLPVSVLQTENPRAQGKGKYYRDLPQVPHTISKEELRAACI